MSDCEFFTRATWRPSKYRKMQKRTKPWGGRKTAPPALLEAAKRTAFLPGRTNRRICSATKRNGGPCGNLALRGLTVCGAHGGFSIWARQGKLQPTGRTAAFKAARAAAVEGQSLTAPADLMRMPVYQQADQWVRMRLVKAWNTQSWRELISQLNQRQQRGTEVCV
jgi:hypothetical protein